jgi:hypothetical protein
VELSRIARLYVEVDVAATLPDGTPTTVSGVDLALLPPRTTPTAATTWTPAAYSAGVATLLVAGPDADPTDALPVPATGADLWARVIDVPEVLAARIDRITIA